MAEIKIRELSIGDWVMNLYANKPSRVIGLRTMVQDTYEIIAVSDGTQYMLIEDKELHNYEPIPLTPEILEKNGFEENCGRWYNSEALMEFEQYKDGWCRTINCGEYSVYFIKYVHQLQRAMKLEGTEKEIIL
jgi:hypothetical protein